MTLPFSQRPWTPVLAVLLAACGAPDSAPKAPAPPPVPVQIVQATVQPVPLELTAVGTVETLASVAIKSRVEGEIVDVRVRDGQDVQTGALLFQIDPRPYAIAVQQAEAALAREQAELEKNQAQDTRYQRPAPQGYVSADDYAQVRANLGTAQAAVKAAEAALAQARLDLEYTRIRAPIAGRAGKVLLRQGNLVRPADTAPLLVIHQLQPVAVSFAVPESALAAVRAAMVKTAPEVSVSAPGVQAHGRLDFLDNAVDAATGTLKLRAVFANGDDALWPGQFVQAVMQLEQPLEVLTVPQAAVQSGPKGSYVFVRRADGTAEQRLVTVARSHADLAVISEGLKADEAVVLDGQSRVVPGATLKVQAQTQAEAAAAP